MIPEKKKEEFFERHFDYSDEQEDVEAMFRKAVDMFEVRRCFMRECIDKLKDGEIVDEIRLAKEIEEFLILTELIENFQK